MSRHRAALAETQHRNAKLVTASLDLCGLHTLEHGRHSSPQPKIGGNGQKAQRRPRARPCCCAQGFVPTLHPTHITASVRTQ